MKKELLLTVLDEANRAASLIEQAQADQLPMKYRDAMRVDASGATLGQRLIAWGIRDGCVKIIEHAPLTSYDLNGTGKKKLDVNVAN